MIIHTTSMLGRECKFLGLSNDKDYIMFSYKNSIFYMIWSSQMTIIYKQLRDGIHTAGLLSAD